MHSKIHDQSHLFLQSLLVIGGSHQLCRPGTDNEACSCVASLSPTVNPHNILQKWITEKRKLAKKDQSTTKQSKVVALEMKFERNSWPWECWHGFVRLTYNYRHTSEILWYKYNPEYCISIKQVIILLLVKGSCL